MEPAHGGPWLLACESGVIVGAYGQWEATMTLLDKAQSWLSGPSEAMGRRQIRAPLEARFCRQGEKGLREPVMDNSSGTWFSARASSKGPGAY